jgi:hypothetical protein
LLSRFCGARGGYNMKNRNKNTMLGDMDTNRSRLISDKSRSSLLTRAGAPLLGLALLAPMAASASTWYVDNYIDTTGSCTADTPSSGPGSCGLRDAIAAAVAGDTIVFDSSLAGSPITLTSGVLTVGAGITIDGSSITGIAVDGGGSYQVFDVSASVTATISGLTIQNGYTTTAGGCIANYGNLTLSGVTVSGCTAYGSSGGGIYNTGTLNLTNSTISGNHSDSYGGGIESYGTLNTLNLTNSTVSGNHSTRTGGGIDCYEGMLTLSNSMVSDNSSTSSSGGGISIGGVGGALALTNSTVSDNSATADGGGI